MPERIETRLLELYVDNFERIMEGWPVYVNGLRRELLEQFNLQVLPGSSREEYRHFDLRGYFAKVRSLPQPGGETYEPLFGFAEIRSIILENGRCVNEGVVELPGGMVYGSLRAAALRFPELVGRYYNTAVDTQMDMPAVLNGIFCEDGAFVYVPDGCRVEEVLHIDIRYAALGEEEINFPRVMLIAGRGASLNVAVTHSDIGYIPVTSCLVREVFIGSDARVEITEAVSMRDDSVLVNGCYCIQHERSSCAGTSLWLKGGATRINSVARLAGKESETTLYGLYLANGRQLCDVNMKVRHEVADCRSFEVIKGVVSSEATGAFTGMVYVAPDAQKTSALQQSRNLQLSDASRIYTEPQLEIYADDVKCSHGATVGQLDDQAVYYMRQRGISEADARRLQLWGFVNDVISRCSAEQVCGVLGELARERISAL